MAPRFEIRIHFNDSDEEIIVKDRAVIEKCKFLKKLVKLENPRWKTKGCIVRNVINVPFPKYTGDFLFANVIKYKEPDVVNGNPTLEDYPEACEIRLGKLREVMGLACFMECNPFHEALGFVCARRMIEFSCEEIAYFFDTEYEGEEDEWTLHPLLGNGI